MKDLLDNKISLLLCELDDIYEFRFLTNYIEDLECNGLPLKKQIEIIEHFRLLLTGKWKQRIEDIFRKNPDFFNLVEKVRGLTLERHLWKYLTMSSVDVERSFSIFRNVVNSKTMKLNQESTNDYMIIRFNKLMESDD